MSAAAAAPLVPLASLDELWFQAGGTLCNLACGHCFVSCHPGNHSFQSLGLETVKRFLDQSAELGVKEYYFTGGEPFLNPELPAILAATLARGPATVLSNGTLIREPVAAELRDIAAASRYSLEIRISIDGPNAAANDALRGQGAFAAALRGLQVLLAHGFLPIITAVQTWPEERGPEVFADFVQALRAVGYSRPRLKIMPVLRLGMEEKRTRSYLAAERVTAEMLAGFDAGKLLCSHSRMVTDRGVAVCPILIEAPGAHLGATLAEASRPFAVDRPACYTCYVHGSICSNAASAFRETDR